MFILTKSHRCVSAEFDLCKNSDALRVLELDHIRMLCFAHFRFLMRAGHEHERESQGTPSCLKSASKNLVRR
jgi:hypothetical protein